jgi:hypothetical protein
MGREQVHSARIQERLPEIHDCLRLRVAALHIRSPNDDLSNRNDDLSNRRFRDPLVTFRAAAAVNWSKEQR